MRESHQLGILFVHGVGEQRRGQILTSFGDPLIRTLGDWLDGRRTGSVRALKSVLSSPPGAFEPAHTVVSVQSKAGAPAMWLLAESWWAGDFERPPFTKLAGWLLTTGAWAMLIHAARPAFQRPPAKVRVAIALFQTLLAIPLAWLLQIAVVLVSLLAWVPFPRFRQMLSNLLLRLSGTLGDSYIFLESPVQRAAAIETTRRSLEWLADQSKKLVVIAHSQGARIAHEVLSTTQLQKPGQDHNVALFISFGGAISKLTELEATARTEAARFVRVALPFALYCIVTFPRAFQTASEFESIHWVIYVCGRSP